MENDFNQGVSAFPSDHCDDYFIELCALSTTDTLTVEEWKQLELHLSICANCREIKAQYDGLIATIVPALAADQTKADDGHASDSWPVEQAEASLMARIDRENISPEKDLPSTTATLRQRRIRWPYAWAAVFLAASIWAAYQFDTHRGRGSLEIVTLPTSSTHDAQHDLPRSVPLPSGQENNEQQQAAKITELRHQLQTSLSDVVRLEGQKSSLEDELARRNTDLGRNSQDRIELERQLALAQSTAQSLQDKLSLSTSRSSQETTQSQTLQAQVEELSASLRKKDQDLAQNEDLLQHDRDIRNLIGARDLYIAEIYDVAKTGKTQKPFGRVFYTRGKSLVFYAYDLDQQPGVKLASTFQAWGRKGIDQQHDINLGIFYQDDQNKKRWVLKSDDNATLSQLDAVFVTVEPHGESSKPSGEPLLFTYLRLTPNHP
ncbi:hypothetical protein [Tunturiibacter gelidiferens]|uniref:Zinc-finger domain-containing protein n=1 Tax=Tunturiibacter gelidiferens TaxID=3069689 RepID=A0AAU7YZC7_9BACT